MIPTYLIGDEDNLLYQLKNDINNLCPQLNVQKTLDYTFPMSHALEIELNALFFMFLNPLAMPAFENIKNCIQQGDSTLICLREQQEKIQQHHSFDSVECLFQPYLPKELIQVVHKVEQKHSIQLQKQAFVNPDEQILAIPISDGYEFIRLHDIVKCQGLKSYTRICTKQKKEIICSNNIGEIRRRLEPFGFFAPHKSFLICLKQIWKYHRDGVIILQDGSEVPLSRRRKEAFFANMLHV